MVVSEIPWSVTRNPKEPDEFDDEYSILYTYQSKAGRLTVLDRKTGYSDGSREIETGLLVPNKDPMKEEFWLAYNFDIRKYPNLTIKEAIEKVKGVDAQYCDSTSDPENYQPLVVSEK